jgi:hypothetical protein
MLPMGFQSRSGGTLIDTLNSVTLHAIATPGVWRRELGLAVAFVDRLGSDGRFSERFAPCLSSLKAHLGELTGWPIEGLGAKTLPCLLLL